MEKNNIFDYCVDDVICDDVYYYIRPDIYSNTCINMAINSESKLLKYSNDWLYLLLFYYNNVLYTGLYNILVETYNKIIETKNEVFINENILPLISSFSTGTAHGYAGIFVMLYDYLENKDKYENYKIAVYSKSQSGILEIIEYFCEHGFIDKQNIIFIDNDVKYRFKKIHLIKINRHVFHPRDEFSLTISNFINNIWIDNSTYKNNRMCIFKTTDSKNVTNACCINKDLVNKFCNKYNLINCSPGINSNENELIFQMKNCEIFITNWGTSYCKNYYYISEKCKYIIVLFPNCYINAELCPEKNSDCLRWCSGYFKNAKILYQNINESEDIILNPIIEQLIL